ncbi:class I SAM-dependent methyltransferase [Sphingobacterium thalpophilum]|uniref:Class I SAM-dependent methyltransferase n=1 Tax=Sphingobacterium thalpophilum TaxID=259 RepID=A0ACD5C5G1_9SPHI
MNDLNPEENYIAINKHSWNNRTDTHLKSDFYNLAGFLKGETSLNSIELALLGDISGKKILHLQCHFGQDTISLSRLGAKITGVDLSDKAIESAREIAKETNADVQFICCDLYELENHLDGQFDLVFTSYGTITWLPDLDKWGKIICVLNKF